MQQNKNILIINDMPGYGKVALAAMLPILSHMGHNIYNLPTALVSNTLDYGKFTILDTTDYMKKSIAVWKELGFSFDCITTGFLASAEQVDIIRAFIESQRKEDLLVMTDPIMGDEGKLYNGVTEETVEKDTQVMVGDPVQVPDGLLEAVCQLAAQREDIRTLWLRQMVRQDGVQSLIIVVDHTGDQAQVFQAIAEAASAHCGQLPVDMIPYGTGFAAAATEDAQPFYHKG